MISPLLIGDRIAEKNSSIWPTLAGLRFVFAAWVLFDHTYNFGPAERAMPVFTKSGLIAVMCFFVISGFSIHHSIANRPEGYGGRRFWRIAPMNVVAVAIGWVAYVVLGLSGGYGTPSNSPGVLKWIGSLLLLECAVPVTIPFLFPAWSLSIEVLFYFAAPTLVKYKHTLAIPAAACMSAVLFMRWPHVRDVYIAEPSYFISAAALLWAWLAGWLAYSHYGNRYLLAAFSAAGFCGIWTQAKYFAIVDFTSAAANVIAWLLTLIVVFYGTTVPMNRKVEKAANYLGEISFPLYLLHYPILFALTSSVLKVHPSWNYGIVQVAIAIICAVLAYHFVDRPLRSDAKRPSQNALTGQNGEQGNPRR